MPEAICPVSIPAVWRCSRSHDGERGGGGGEKKKEEEHECECACYASRPDARWRRIECAAVEEAHLCRRGEERQVEIGEEGKYGRRLSGDGKSQLYPFLTLINRFLLATKRLYMSVCPSVGWSDGPTVTNHFFGLLGATRALLDSSLYEGVSIRLLDGRLGRFSYTNCLRFCH